MQRVADGAPYLFPLALGEVLRIFYLRENRDLEWSALRIALEASGIKAHNPQSDWGALAAAMKEANVLELVGRQTAVAASRNGARNSTWKLTALWYGYAQQQAERKGWRQVVVGTAQQTALI